MTECSDDDSISVSDYTNMSMNLTFNAATSTQTVEISTAGDMVLEMSKSFNVSLSQMPVDTAVTLDPASATVNIQDDDSKLMKGSLHFLSPLHNSFSSSAVTIGFNATAYTVTEGDSASVSVSVLNGTLARDVVVTLQTVADTATGSKRIECIFMIDNTTHII